MPATFLKTTWSFIACLIACPLLFAHNGSIAHAYPLGRIIIDGNFTDWPKDAFKYPIARHLSDTKPRNDSDFSGFFHIGYRPDNRSLYLAFAITDEDFIQDTTANVQWNSQDGLEIALDARHLLSGSGVASFMYSKKLRNTNNAFYDPFAKNATWDIMEVAMVTQGNTRYYEWRIQLGNEMAAGKSIGFDFQVFDRDNDGSFSFSAWGKGGAKFRNPNSLGDVILLPANTKLATVSGKVNWDKPGKEQLPLRARLVSAKNPQFWVQAELDSAGNYTASVPEGSYELMLSDQYFMIDNIVYGTGTQKPFRLIAKTGQKNTAPQLLIPGVPVPDLLPEKGILHNFTAANARQVDHFIQSYQGYFGIPGVSLALIKDGKAVYHKTYGVTNTMTGDKVNGNTLFEAASITKPVFSFAVLRLAERGIIDLDKPLWQYLPYPDIEHDERYKLITAKHVLTHRTGFPNWRYMNADAKLDIKFTPGTDYGYSGEGFEYLKMVVEKITGKKVEQVLQEEVIEPIGLYHTFFSRNDSLQQMVAYGHYDRLPTINELPASPGMAYSMHTEAKIFTRFMLYMLEQKGLKPETYDMMFRKHSEFNFDPGEEKPKYPVYMGISLEIRETPFGKSFGHGGNNGDFKCKFEMYKDSKMGYVIFTNSNASDPLLENLRKFLVEGKDN
ncbi:MAG TPA: serine hydrolase [Chitinophagaceae bacterium]|nr:serine hydrolase [Chitinophagaceae bacterium]